jgi:hypothetical protein
LLDFIEGEATALRATLPALPATVRVPTLMDVGELLAFATLALGTHGDVLDEFHRLTRAGARMWTFERFLYEKFGRIPEKHGSIRRGTDRTRARCWSWRASSLGWAPARSLARPEEARPAPGCSAGRSSGFGAPHPRPMTVVE